MNQKQERKGDNEEDYELVPLHSFLYNTKNYRELKFNNLFLNLNIDPTKEVNLPAGESQ